MRRCPLLLPLSMAASASCSLLSSSSSSSSLSMSTSSSLSSFPSSSLLAFARSPPMARGWQRLAIQAPAGDRLAFGIPLFRQELLSSGREERREKFFHAQGQRPSLFGRLMMSSAASAGERCVKESMRFQSCFIENQDNAIPIIAVKGQSFSTWLQEQDENTKKWMNTMQFTAGEADAGKHIVIPRSDLSIEKVVVIVGDDGFGEWLSFAGLPTALPKGSGPYKIVSSSGVDDDKVALAWALGCYKFDVYKSKKKKDNGEEKPGFENLVWPEGCDREYVLTAASAIYMTRDLISTPAEDMAPGDLETAAKQLSSMYGARITTVVGEDLLRQNYPQIHAVGRATPPGKHAPRLIDLRWGKDNDPKVTLVGKGITFDTGGLDIKPSAGMRQMKKDMGGSALVLGLAHMIMRLKMNVRLRVLIAAAENNVDAVSFRPGDILVARNGMTTEIGNTDAEGRLVMADALVAACEEKPELLIDAATLTGAGRVALGTDVPAVFCNNEEIASQLCSVSEQENDLVWRLPLFKGYAKSLSSRIADMKNVAEGSGYGGAITAALYLQKFVTAGTNWIHMDFMAFNTASRPGRPEGGEAMGLRALFSLLKSRFHQSK